MAKMLSVIITFVLLNFVLIKTESGESDNPYLVYLTIADDPLNIQVNINANPGDYKVVTKSKADNKHNASLNYPLHATPKRQELLTYIADIAASNHSGNNEYRLPNLEERSHSINFPSANSSDITLCIFGDYTAMLDSDRVNISRYMKDNECMLNIFVGRVTWVTSDGGLVYDSFTALHGESDKHKALAEVPSILGVSGANLTESTYFQSTEVHGIAFIQCAATIATTANIIPGTEQFEKVTEYFRETMLNELECKLQELHQRKNKPWIIIYLTHIDPDYGTQEQLTTLTLNESPSFAKRFFELITRYKIDLIASCGNFGMPEMFKQHAIDFPSDRLPKYFRVSFSGYGFGASICSENDEGENNEGGDGFFDECNYVVLDVTKHDTSFYYKKRPSGKILESGTIYKNTQEPEKCVEKEL